MGWRFRPLLLCAALLLIIAPASARGYRAGHSHSYHSRSYQSLSYSSRSYRTRSYRSPSSGHVRSYTRSHGAAIHSHSRSYRGTGPSRSHSRTSSHHSYSAPRRRSYRSTRSAVATRDKHGRIRRSAAAKDAFKRQHPCPSTGRTSGSCPGYVIDHRQPLECGGADAASNMQWQTIAEGKAKDRTERLCR